MSMSNLSTVLGNGQKDSEVSKKLAKMAKICRANKHGYHSFAEFP